MKKFLLLLLSLSSFGLIGQGTWIKVGDQDVVSINSPSYPKGLFDEGPRLLGRQGEIRSEPKRHFKAHPQRLYLPQKYLLSLKGKFQIDSLVFFDGAGKDSLKIALRKNDSWHYVFKGQTNKYQEWRRLKINLETDYLLFEFASAQTEIGEILLFGQALSQEASPTFSPPPKKRPLSLNEFIGINAFVDDPISNLKAVSSSIREYHNWNWHFQEGLSLDEALRIGPAFAPSANGHWNFDQYYQNLNASGLKVIPCLQGSPDWLGDFDDKPILDSKTSEDPHSYRIHSKFMFQYAARYGKQKHAAKDLHVATGQSPKSGLNLIQGIENWNEPDKWWRGDKGYFNAWEFAAMLSADYDGHAGRLGNGYGLKNADPSLEFVMGGICSLNLQYIEAIRIWSIFNRPEKDFPADAINFHHYSNDAGGQGDRIKHAVSPEEDELYQRLKALVLYRDKYLPRQKIYLSEFGYDSNRKSVQAAPAADSLQSLERQANLIVRSFLWAHASGIDGAFLYMYRDVNTANPTKFQSSGLSREKWNRSKLKPSFYKLRALKRLLGDYHFVKMVQAKFIPSIEVMLYENQQGHQRYVMWNKDLGSTYFPRSMSFDPGQQAKVYRLPDNEGPIRLETWKSGEELAINAAPLIIEFD